METVVGGYVRIIPYQSDPTRTLRSIKRHKIILPVDTIIRYFLHFFTRYIVNRHINKIIATQT